MIWQAIETAEKRTRRRVILYCPSRVGRKVVEGYHGFNGVFTAWFCSDSGFPVVPTHWTELPAPPDGKQEDPYALSQSTIISE